MQILSFAELSALYETIWDKDSQKLTEEAKEIIESQTELSVS